MMRVKAVEALLVVLFSTPRALDIMQWIQQEDTFQTQQQTALPLYWPSLIQSRDILSP